MMLRAFLADWLKIRCTWVIWLTLLGPLGNLFAQWVNYLLRKEYLLKGDWMGLLSIAAGLVPFSLLMGVVLIASISSGHEHDGQAFKHVFAMPVSRTAFFLSKAVWIFLLLGLAAGLTVLGLGWFGMAVDLSAPVPWSEIAHLIFIPYLSVTPCIVLQLWLSLVRRGQAWPIVVGIAGAIYGGGLARSNSVMACLFWNFPYRLARLPFIDPVKWMWVAGGWTVVFLVAGLLHFGRREIQ